MGSRFQWLPWRWGFSAAGLTFAVGLAPAVSGCGDSTCRGVVVDGECLATCNDDDCDDGEQCLEQRCAARCSDDADCDDGECQRLEADNGEKLRFCVDDVSNDDVLDDDSSGDAGGGFSPECRSTEDCDGSVAQRCVDGLCRVACQLHDHCGAAGSCSLESVDAEDAPVSLCEGDDFPRSVGEYGTACPHGNQDCSADFRCVGAGEGDASAYCTATGCDVDSDCPTGFFCSYNRTTQPPCESACGLIAEATNPNCIPAEAIGEGAPFRCSERGDLELRICLRRTYCTPCDSDADCRSEANQICAEGGDGTKICTVLCDPSTNSCPWGSASSCDVWDERLGLPTCGHRSGACRQQGDSCDPCIDDRDCPVGFCGSNPFTGEQFCVDETATCECSAGSAQCIGGGCPLTPGGLQMNCVPRAADAPPDACYGAPTIPSDPTSPLGCWPREAQSL